MAVWEAWSWKEQARTKPLAKGGADSLCFSPRAGAATGAEPCIMMASGERPAVWGMCGVAAALCRSSTCSVLCRV